jgi:REP element-mobilizing transposase RayT
LRYANQDCSFPRECFFTINIVGIKEWFGKVINSKMHLSEIGQIASQVWYEIPVHFPFIGLDAFVVIPDHIHGIIVINRSIRKSIVGALHATPHYKIRPSLTTSKRPEKM